MRLIKTNNKKEFTRFIFYFACQFEVEKNVSFARVTFRNSINFEK
jgi:hypothetical protein